MIVSRLMGGLGNQMFQYAAGFALARRLNTEFFIDTSHYSSVVEHDTKYARKPELSILQTSAQEMPDYCEFRGGILPSQKRTLREKIKEGTANLFPPKQKPSAGVALRIKREGKKYNYDSKAPKLRDNTYLFGYWQSERYFTNAREAIRQEFTFADPPSTDDSDCLRLIQATDNSVALHFRRGDYVSTPKLTKKTSGICDLNYYMSAIALIEKRSGKPATIFVFSDDMDYFREHFELGRELVFVTHNVDKKSSEDMRLMSHCQHNIIANSSFSWWGAWLNDNRQKIVVAPDPWFNDEHRPDIIPPSWHRLGK